MGLESNNTISIITPVHNEAKYIDKMLASLAGQTYSDWQAIIVNDGSTDHTSEIVYEWTIKDERIRLIDPPRKPGKVPAFNLAFAAAAGKYICHVGGDDILPSHSLESRVRALRSEAPMALALGKLQFIDDAGRHLGKPIPRGRTGSQSSPGATYTRELANLIFPVPPELPSEDIWLGNAARACSTTVVHIPEVVTHYRRHVGNSNPRWKSYEEMDEAIAVRMHAHNLLLDSDIPIPEPYRKELRRRVKNEQLRYNGRTARLLLSSGTRIVDRLALASMSNPTLWRLRQHAGHRASGWRGR